MIGADARRAAYLGKLRSAIDWALCGERDAWSRTMAAIAASDGSYSREALEAAKDALLARVDERLATWLESMLDEAKDPDDSELECSPEEVWRSLLCLNSGIFATEAARDLLLVFMTTIPSTVPGQGPLYMSPLVDGWGVAAASTAS
jgi:hypothetical protein